MRVNCSMIDDSKNKEARRAFIAEFDWAEEVGYTFDAEDFELLYLADINATLRDEDGEILKSFEL